MKAKFTAFANGSRIILFLTLALALLGLTTFFVMPREEDPRIKRRNGVMTLVLPGAGPEKIERMVMRPLEDKLLKVEELKRIETEIRLNVAVVKLELKDEIGDLVSGWREIEDAIDRAVPNLPKEIGKPIVDFGVLDVESVIVAITGTDDRVVLIDAAKKLQDRLLRNPDVAETKLFGAPDLEVVVAVRESAMHAHGISVRQLLHGIQENNSAIATGLVVDGKERVLLNQDNDFSSLESIRKIKYETGRLRNIELGSFSEITRSAATPLNSLFRWQGKTAVGIGLVPKQGLNVEAFGKEVLAELESARRQVAPLKIEMVAFQPRRTEERIDDLLMSLLSGMALIAVFLSLTTSAASALIVGVCVPIISLIGLFFYYLAGGILHQISIAAFVISIGQFIDNIIVVIDSIQTKIRSGQSPTEAAMEASSDLRFPMAFATATGICAFLPMLSAQGSPADFIFSLPLVAVITLVTSYFIAIFFTPIIAARLIRPGKEPLVRLPFSAIERGFTSIALGSAWRIASLILLISIVSAVAFFNVEREFFPESDRNEFLFAIDLNPSADSTATDQILSEIEAHYSKDPRVQSLASFTGGDIPRFYYNLPNPKAAPQSGQILVTTNELADVKRLGLEMEERFKRLYPNHSFTAQFLQQGPPINAKIEINVFTENPERREALTAQVQQILHSDQRVRSVRADDFKGLKQLELNARDSKLTDIGFSRGDLSQVIAFYSSGVPVSAFRFGRDIIPIRVREQNGPYRSPESLKSVTVLRGRDRDFKLQELVSFEERSGFPILRRENGLTFSRVLADLMPGHTFDRVMKDMRIQMASITLEPGERIDFGGDAKGAGEANDSILKVVPAAMILLILFLLIEFRSYRKVLIAALALPVTLMGVFPGLWLGGAPFGFMSLLGILALVGIAINNIILLLEALDTEENLRTAIAVRLRAIILTTVLTLLGLIPLALSESSLWPPLAWTMISGLLTGTVATLIVVPALYRAFFKRVVALVPVIAVLAFGVVPYSAEAQVKLSIDEILLRVSSSEDHQLVKSQQLAAKEGQKGAWREAFAPRLVAGGQWFQRDRELATASPFGDLTQEKQGRSDVQLELQQPLFDSAKMLSAKTAADLGLKAASLSESYDYQTLRLKFATLAIAILVKQREQKFIADSIENLRTRQKDVKRLIEKGRQSRSDSLKLDIARERLIHNQEALSVQIESLKAELRRALRIEGDIVVVPPKPVSSQASFELSMDTGDLANLRIQSEILQARKEQVKASSLPVVHGFARLVGTEGRTLTERQWTEAGVELRWEIWGGGVRKSQAGQLEAQRSGVLAQEALLRRQKSTNFEETQARMREGLRWMAKLEELNKKALSSRKDEEARYFGGRGSLNDLMEADNLGLELQKDSDVTALNLIADCMYLQLWAGHEVSSTCGG